MSVLEFPSAFLVGPPLYWRRKMNEGRWTPARFAFPSSSAAWSNGGRVPGGLFDCGASFIVIVGNEVGTVHTSVWRSLSQSLFLFLFFLFVSLSIHAGPIFASSRTGSFITSRRIVNIYIPVVASSPFDDTYKENSYSKGYFRFPNKKKTIEGRKKTIESKMK